MRTLALRIPNAAIIVSVAATLLSISNPAWPNAITREVQMSPLEELAPFSDLHPCEKLLLASASAGTVAVCGVSNSAKDGLPPVDSAPYARRNTIRADLVRWMYTDIRAQRLIDPRGIRIQFASVSGILDLSHVVTRFPFTCMYCRIENAVDVTDAQIPGLTLTGSGIHGLSGERVSIAGAVLLNKRFFTDRVVNLREARIGGDLDCSNGRFEVPNGTQFEHSHEMPICKKYHTTYALNANGAHVGGSVYLKDGFHSISEVRLPGISIGGVLDATKGHFENPCEVAIGADLAKVTDGVWLRDGFQAKGSVRLDAAFIGGILDGREGDFEEAFSNLGRAALSANGAKIVRGMYVTHSLIREGDITLVDATINSDLMLNKTHFAGKSTISLERTTIRGMLFWRDLILEPHLIVLDLRNTQVGSLVDDENSWPQPGNLQLDGFTYHRLVRSVQSVQHHLKWLRLQQQNKALRTTASSQFERQPYIQLADVLRSEGDDAGATDVLIAMENDHLWNSPHRLSELASNFVLWATIDYGYEPLRVFYWISGFVILGTFLFSLGYNAHVMTPIGRESVKARPFNSFIYSLEMFLPVVDLKQGKYWTPDAQGNRPQKSASVAVLRPMARVCISIPHAPRALTRWLLSIRYRIGPNCGRHLRWYLWLHILAGWFFTSMLIAGVTLLVRKS